MTTATSRRRVRLASSLVLATAGALALFAQGACSYSPNIESGSLGCSPQGDCPRGFTCASSGPRVGRCVTGSGTTGTGGAGAGGTSGFPDGGMGTPGGDAKADFHLEAPPDIHLEAPPVDLIAPGTGGSMGAGGVSGDAGVPSSSAASYIGTWVFNSASYVYDDCGPGYTPQTTSLAASTLQIHATANGADILGASWSVWNDCPYELYLDELGVHLYDSTWSCQDTTKDPAAYWEVYSFEVVTSNGLTATHDAQYQRGYFYADGTTLACHQTVHAVMNRR